MDNLEGDSELDLKRGKKRRRSEENDEEEFEEPVAPKKKRRLLERKNAFVTLVMKSTNYVPGAIILAHSLRLTQTNALLVCLITKEVIKDPKAVAALKQVFDYVSGVGYINCPCKDLKTEKIRSKYQHWIDSSFTKWNCLRLPQIIKRPVEKVVFLDADVVVLENIDDLFDLDAPAATFSNPWTTKGNNNRYGGLKNFYPKSLRHGDEVDGRCIQQALLRGGFVPPGTCYLLPTMDDNTFKKKFLVHLKKVRKENDGYYGWNCFSGMDEQCMAYYFTNVETESRWKNIDPVYNFIPWHFDWLKDAFGNFNRPKCLHFFGNKPWETSPREWNDLRVWWCMVKHLLSDESGYDEVQREKMKTQFKQEYLLEVDDSNRCFWCVHMFGKRSDQSIHLFWDPQQACVTCPQMRR